MSGNDGFRFIDLLELVCRSDTNDLTRLTIVEIEGFVIARRDRRRPWLGKESRKEILSKEKKKKMYICIGFSKKINK